MSNFDPRQVAAVINYLTLMGEEIDGVSAMDLTEGFDEFDCRACARRFLDDMVSQRILIRKDQYIYTLGLKYKTVRD